MLITYVQRAIRSKYAKYASPHKAEFSQNELNTYLV